MLLKKIWYKNSLYKNYLSSYTFLIIIILLISTVAYITSLNIIKTEITKSQYEVLKLLQQSVDSKLSDLEKSSTSIALDKNLNIQTSLIDDIVPMYRSSVLKLINTLETYKITVNHVSDIFINYNNNNRIVSEKGTCESEQYFELYYDDTINNSEQWLNFLRKPHYKEFVTLKSDNQGISKIKYIAFLQSIPLYNFKDPYATLTLMYNCDHLQKLLNNLKNDNDVLTYIVNENNEIIASSETNYINNKYLKTSDNKEGIIYKEINKKKYAILYLQSSINKWKYITLIPNKIFYEKAVYLKKIIFICILICIILGLSISIYFSRLNYSPIKNMLDLFKSNNNYRKNNKLNELELIKLTITKVLEENKKINNNLKQKNKDLRSYFLFKLIKGQVNDNMTISAINQKYDLNLVNGFFTLVMIKYKETNDYQYLLSTFIIKNIINELFNKNNICFSINIEHSIFCFINTDKYVHSNNNNIQNDILANINRAKEIIYSNFQIEFLATVSNTYNEINNVNYEYNECVKTMEYISVLGIDTVAKYNDICSMNKYNFSNTYPIVLQQKFISHIIYGNFKEARNIMNRLFDNNLSKHYIPLDMVRCLMYAITNTMINAIYDSYWINVNEVINEIKPINNLFECKSIIEMKTQLNNVLFKIEEYYNKKRINNNTHRIKEIINFIQSNYNNYELTATSIANEFNLNSVYLSKFFKEQTGTGLLYVINKTRIDKSKKLLLDTNISIKEITKKVGYINTTTYIRIFKKYEGITPGKYRSNKGSDNKN